MRPVFISAVVFMPFAAFAQSSSDTSDGSASSESFKLGGAASRAAIVATTPTPELTPERSTRLSLPLALPREETARTESALGIATVFLSDGLESGQDALELGTFLSRGQTTAGLSVTYFEEKDELARSEIYLDFALTDRFSVGLSGILDTESNDDPVRQLGVNAEFSTSTGTYIQGGFTGAPDYDPVIGLSVGLRL